MLCLTRMPNEEIIIGDPRDPIGRIQIQSVKGQKVRIGLEFPREIQITRAELVDRAPKPARTEP